MITKTKDLVTIDMPQLARPLVEMIPTPMNWKIVPQQSKHFPNQSVYPSTSVKRKAPSESDIKSLLSDAAAYLEKDGSWCQNALGNDNQVCVVGAMLRMETGDKNEVYQPTQPFRHPLTSAAVEKLSEHLDKKGIKVRRIRGSEDPDFAKVSNWNDDPKRTKAEVIGLLRDASK